VYVRNSRSARLCNMPFCSSRYRYNACTGSNLYPATVLSRNDILLRSMKFLSEYFFISTHAPFLHFKNTNSH